jgi:two-component system response regulator HydG
MNQEKGNILIVDDDQGVLYTAKMILKQHYLHVITENNPVSAFESFQKYDHDVVLLDMNFRSGATDGQEGIELLTKMRDKKPETLIIMHTAYGDIDLAVQAMKIGAIDFLVKPWEKEKLLSTVNNVYQLKKSRQELKEVKSREEALKSDIEKGTGELLWKDKSMQSVMQMVDKVATTSANILILGENGTGKELVARALHRQSTRADKPFIKVDLGTISETLFESELFGHAKGAFTDAKEAKAGRFEIAHGGTLFLDEIGNLSLNMQAKILTAIQSRQINRVGSSNIINLDIRLICATNKDLFQEVEDKNFRQDLLYRINTVELSIPPLRDRTRDIPFLILHFIQVFSKKYDKKGLTIEANELEELIDYHWPGNVRELQHAVERAVILSTGTNLESKDFIRKQETNSNLRRSTDSFDVKEVEKLTIQEALLKTKGNLTNAANELGIGRTTLYRKIKKYQL